MDSLRGTRSKGGRAALVICLLSAALETVQTVIAELQPAESGPVTIKSNRLGPMIADTQKATCSLAPLSRGAGGLDINQCMLASSIYVWRNSSCTT